MPAGGVNSGTIWAALALRLEQLFQNAQQAQQLMQQLDANMQAAATKASAAASTAAATHAKGVAQAVQQAAVIQQQAAEQALRVEMSQWKMRIAATAQGAAEQKAILQQYYNWLQTQAAMPGIRPGTLASLNNEIASVTRQINNLGKETQTVGQGIEATFGRMQRTLAAIVGVEVFRYLTTALTQLPQLAFQTEAGFRILERQAQATGQSIDSVHASMQRLADDLHTAKEALAQPVAELMRYGYTVEQIEGIFRGAAASGLLMGKTIDQSIQTVSEALISQRSVLLNEVGIVENLDGAYTQYARSLGKTADELTAQEKAQASYQMIVRATASEVKDLPILMEGYGGATAEAGLATYKLKQAVGEALLPVMTQLKMAFAGIIEGATPLLSILASLTDDAIPALVAVISYRLVTALTALSAKLMEAAAKGTLFQAAINPIAGVIAAVAAGLAYFGIRAAAASKSAGDYYNQGIKAAQASYDQSQKLHSLIREYETLSGKPDKSKEEHARLKQVMEDIIRIQPDIAKGYDDIGAAIDRNLETVKSFADELERQSTTKIYALANEFEAINKPRLEAQNAQLKAENKRLTDENGRKLAESTKLAHLAGEAKLLISQMNTAKSQGDLKAVPDLQKKLTEVLRQWKSNISIMGSLTPWGAYVQQLSDEAAKAVNAQSAVSNRLDEIDAQLKANNLELEKGNLLLQARDRIAKGLTPFPDTSSGSPVIPGPVGGGKGKEKSPLQQWRDDTEHFRNDIELAKAGFGDLDKALIAYRDNLRKTAADESVTSEVRAAAAKELQTTLHELVQWRLDWFQTAKDKDYIEVNTYAKQISYLENIIDKQDELQMLTEDKAAVQQVLWETRKAQYEEEVKLNNWSAQQQVEKYQELVAAHAVSFEQRKEAEIELADLTARANDAAYKAAVESYDKLTRNVEMTAEQRLAIYQQEVVDKLANTKKSADAEKAIALQVLDLQAAVAKERVQIADQTRDLEIDAIELAGEKVEAEIQRELQARDKALRQVGLSEYQKALIVDKSEKRIQEIRRKAAEDEANELEQWTDSYFQHEIEMGRATTQGYANALREVRRINEERGIFSEELNRKIERLERQAGNEALAITADVESTRMQIRINTLVAGNAKRLAEELQLEKELHDRKAEIQNDETLTVEQKNLKIEEAETNHKAKLAELNRRYTDQEIQIQMSALETLASARELTLQESLDLLDLKRRVEISNAMETTSNLETINAGYRALELKTRQEYAQKAVRAEIEAFGELEDHSIEASKKKIAAWKKTYTDMGDAGKLALEEIAALETKLADEEQRRAEEREQWLLSTGQKSRVTALAEAVSKAQEKLNDAEKAGIGITEAQQELDKALFEQKRGLLDIDREYYDFQVQMGQLTNEQRLEWIRNQIAKEKELLGVQVENSDTWKALKTEEFQVLQDLHSEQIQTQLDQIKLQDESLDGLRRQQYELSGLLAYVQTLGPEWADAAKLVNQALGQTSEALRKAEEDARKVRQEFEAALAPERSEAQKMRDWMEEQVGQYLAAGGSLATAFQWAQKQWKEFLDKQREANRQFWQNWRQDMLRALTGPLNDYIEAARAAWQVTGYGVDEAGNRYSKMDQAKGQMAQGQIFQGIGTMLQAAAGPLAAIFLELVKAAEPLKPVWDAMGKVFKLLADIVGMMILPIFKALWPVIKGFGWVMAEVALIIGKAWNALVWLIDQIPFIDMSAYYMNTDDIEKKRDEIGAMQYPGDSSGSSSGKAGTQVMNMTGETRDVFVELLRPLTNLNILPGLFDNMLQRLDAIVEMLRGLQSMVLEIPEAAITIMRATITVQSADAVYVTGPIQGGSDLGMNAMTAARVGV